MSCLDPSLYAFHQASIHERRFAAKFFAALPLLLLATYFATLVYALRHSHAMLLTMAAVLNTSTWLWITSTALLGIAGASFATDALRRYQRPPCRPCPSVGQGDSPLDCAAGLDTVDKVVHMIVLPNFKEGENMLTETLQSLSEADESDSFCVVLAMEQRESKSLMKAQRIQKRFQQSFAGIAITVHPSDLQQSHLDDSSDQEVPGKASNLKWAVPQAFEEFEGDGLIKSRSSVILTVADADCIFHPGYFSAVGREFNMLRENPGNDHLWTMYQAPQLPYRNFSDSAACSRIWGYISSTYEFGGVCNLSFGGTHMTFSGYSLPLQLALGADAWDGDIIAEDHHAFLKCFFYSALASVEASGRYTACTPQLKVQPIYLPVKSTSVAGESYLSTCVDRWCQAKRHAQGAAELSYAMLAAYDALLTLPWKSQCLAFHWQVSKVIGHLLCMHLLPLCQGIGLLAVTMVWLYHGRHLPLCPTDVTVADVLAGEYAASHYLLCGFGGAGMLIWPMVLATSLIILANYLFLRAVFIRGKDTGKPESVWHAQDGGTPLGGIPHIAALVQISFDCTFLASAMMIPYGFCANILAFIDIAIYGNRIKYVTASKPITTTKYGTLSSFGPPQESKYLPSEVSTSEGSCSESGEEILEPLTP